MTFQKSDSWTNNVTSPFKKNYKKFKIYPRRFIADAGTQICKDIIDGKQQRKNPVKQRNNLCKSCQRDGSSNMPRQMIAKKLRLKKNTLRKASVIVDVKLRQLFVAILPAV